ncbi:MAG: DUF4861 family protein [Gemmatimonadaceae bacterium]
MTIRSRFSSLLLATPFLLSPTLGAQSTRLVVKVTNPLAIERRDETITLTWADVTKALPGAAKDKIRVRDAVTGAEFPSQAVDENGDGSIDDFVFQANFWPKESKSFAVEAVAAAVVKPKTFVYHDATRDDIAWENDRIAFRIYGQGIWHTKDSLVSAGIDVWPKSVRDLIVDKWYKKGHDEYHVDTGEGADFFEVGTTLGAGGTALWQDNKIKQFENFKTSRIITMGPVRAIFELTYDPVKANGYTVAETKRFVIDAGNNLYREESTFKIVGAASAPYAIGVVKKDGLVGSSSLANPWAWVTGWAQVHKKHGGHGYLGTAVMLEKSRVTELREIDDHYIAVTAAKNGEKVVHYIGAGWTDSGDFKDVMDWWGYLDKFAQRLGAPLKVTLGAEAQ